MVDLSIALGSGKILAVLALDAHHHHLANGAPSLNHVHCLAVSVADSWTGDAIAEVLKRLIAQIGRPAAYLKDSGRELQKAVDLLEPHGLSSLCIDEMIPRGHALVREPLIDCIGTVDFVDTGRGGVDVRHQMRRLLLAGFAGRVPEACGK